MGEHPSQYPVPFAYMGGGCPETPPNKETNECLGFIRKV